MKSDDDICPFPLRYSCSMVERIGLQDWAMGSAFPDSCSYPEEYPNDDEGSDAVGHIVTAVGEGAGAS